MNRFQTGQGPRHANLHQCGLAQSPSCDYGKRQTMNHIVDTYPLTKFGGRLNLLPQSDDDAVIWLESTVTAALAKQYYLLSVPQTLSVLTIVNKYILSRRLKQSALLVRSRIKSSESESSDRRIRRS